MGLGGRFTDVERCGYLPVAQATGEKPENLDLALGQVAEPRVIDGLSFGLASELLDQPFGDRRRKQRVAVGDDPQGGEQLRGWRVFQEVSAGAATAGVVAAWLPARRAGRLDVLDAIAH